MVVVSALRKTSRLVLVEDAKVGTFNLVDQVFAAVIIRMRVPSVMVGVPVPQDEAIFRSAGKDGGDIGLESSRAGRRRRDVDVDD